MAEWEYQPERGVVVRKRDGITETAGPLPEERGFSLRMLVWLLGEERVLRLGIERGRCEWRTPSGSYRCELLEGHKGYCRTGGALWRGVNWPSA